MKAGKLFGCNMLKTKNDKDMNSNNKGIMKMLHLKISGEHFLILSGGWDSCTVSSGISCSNLRKLGF